MKVQTILFFVLLQSGYILSGQDKMLKIGGPHYGIGILYVRSGSGQGAGYSLTGVVTKGRKSLEAGVIYSNRESKISGGDLNYRIYLGAIGLIEEGNKIFSSYLQYNLMYQKSTSYSPDLLVLGGETYEIEGVPGTVATLGHYLGYGTKIRLFCNVYLENYLGLGVYHGSIDKIQGHGTWGIQGSNSGLTYSFKTGIVVTFSRVSTSYYPVLF